MAIRHFTRVLICILVLCALIASFFFFRFVLDPVRIGVILPVDTSLGNEINLFVRYYQGTGYKHGLRPVKFIIKNPPSDRDAVLEAYSLLDELGVSLIIGGVLSKDGSWLAEAAKESGIPTFGVTASSAALSGMDDNFFRLCPSNDAQAKAVALTYKKKNCEKLMLVTSESNAAYVEPYVAMLERHFPGTILQLPFITTEELSRGIDRFKPDGLFNILPAKDLIQVINLIRERGDTFIVGSASWGSTEILSLYSGPALDGVLFFLLGLDELTGSYKAEISSFEERYRMTATNGTFYAVSIMHIIREAVLAVGPSRAALKTWLATPRTYTTAFGSLAMDEFGDSVTGKTLIMQTANGILRQVEYVEDSR